jgi:hypothetical protein
MKCPLHREAPGRNGLKLRMLPDAKHQEKINFFNFQTLGGHFAGEEPPWVKCPSDTQ